MCRPVVVWPPKPSVHAILPPPTSTQKRMSICSQEVSSLSEQKVGYISIKEVSEERPASPIPFKKEPLDPKLIKTVKETAMKHTTETKHLERRKVQSDSLRKSPELIPIHDRPHDVKSLLVDASKVRPLSPVQVVVFPPELPDMLPVRPRSTTPKKNLDEMSKGKSKNVPVSKRSKSPNPKKTKDVKAQGNKVEMSVSVKREVNKFENVQHKDKPATSIRDLPKPIMESGAMASALATAPNKPFRPKVVTERALVPTGKVGLPPESEPYFPPEHGTKDEKVAQALREVGCKSPMTEALTTASDRPYSPLPPATQSIEISSSSTVTTSSVTNIGFQPVRKPVSMLSALTVAPTVPFTVPGKTPVPTDSLPVPSAFKPISNSSPTFVPVPGRPHSPMKYYPAFTRVPQPSPPPEIARGEFIDKDHIHYETTRKPPSPRPKQITTTHVTETTTGKTNTLKSKQTTKSTESETFLLPYYQQSIGEIPVRNRSISPIRQIKAPTFSPAEQVLHPPPNVKHMSETKLPQPKVKEQHPTEKKESYPLHAPNLLPYYQQNIGEIPVRNKSISPVPHPIKAPSFDPKKMVPSPVNLCYSSNSTVPTYGYTPSPVSHSVKSIQTQTERPQVKQIKEVIRESMSEEMRNLSKEEKEIHKSVTKITQGVLRPASPSTWKANVNKQVQNLSPITVRIPSPIPKPLGHTRESVGSNIHITHHRDHTSSVSVTPIPDENNTIPDARGKSWGKQSSPLTKPSPNITTTGQQKNISLAGKQIYGGNQSSVVSTNKLNTHNGTQFNGTQGKVISAQGTILGQQMYHGEKQMSSVTTRQMYSGGKQVTTSKQIIGNDKVSNPTLGKDKYGSSSPFGISSSSYSSEKYITSPSVSRKSYTNEKLIPKIEGQHSTTAPVSNSTKPSHSTISNIQIKSYKNEEKHSKDDTQTIKKTTTVIANNDKSGGSGRIPSQSLHPTGSCGSSGGNGTGGGAGAKGSVAGSTAPRRGKGVLNPNVGPSARIPLCGQCSRQIRGPFITALGKIWCPEHFVCVNAQCSRPLQDIGFVEEQEGLYCEFCFEKYLAPNCSKCNSKIKGDCLNAIGKQFHPECFCCTYCGKIFGNNPFFLEDSLPYCQADWNELFTTKCFSCGFPIEAGDRWVEALSNNYHSQCFNCTMCKKNLEGQSFFAKGGRPFCKNHAR